MFRSVDTTATHFQPLRDRSTEWARRMEMIRDAQQFLVASTYYIEHDAFGGPFLEALTAAARRGVEVSLLIDTFGQRLGGVLMSDADKAALAQALETLKAAGGDVAFYAPGRRLSRALGGGQHIKIQMSERGDALFGSSNITRASFDGWREFSAQLRGPVTWVLLESFGALRGGLSRRAQAHLDAAHVESVADASSDALPLVYWEADPNPQHTAWGPLGSWGHNKLTHNLVGMINSAQRSVQLTSFFIKPPAVLLRALVDAARRGVAVTLHHSHRDALPDTLLPWLAAAAQYPALLDAGARIFEDLTGEHSKIVLVDDAWGAFGSYNFEHAADDRLAEAMLASRDGRVLASLRAVFDALPASPHSVEVTRATLATLPLALRARARLLGPVRRWM